MGLCRLIRSPRRRAARSRWGRICPTPSRFAASAPIRAARSSAFICVGPVAGSRRTAARESLELFSFISSSHFGSEVREVEEDAGDVIARMREAGNQAAAHGVALEVDRDDRNGPGGRPSRLQRRRTVREHQIDILSDDFCRHGSDPAGIAFGDAGTELLKPSPEDVLRMRPVSKRVSKPGNTDDATLIDPIAFALTGTGWQPGSPLHERWSSTRSLRHLSPSPMVE